MHKKFNSKILHSFYCCNRVWYISPDYELCFDTSSLLRPVIFPCKLYLSPALAQKRSQVRTKKSALILWHYHTNSTIYVHGRLCVPSQSSSLSSFLSVIQTPHRNKRSVSSKRHACHNIPVEVKNANNLLCNCVVTSVCWYIGTKYPVQVRVLWILQVP